MAIASSMTTSPVQPRQDAGRRPPSSCRSLRFGHLDRNSDAAQASGQHPDVIELDGQARNLPGELARAAGRPLDRDVTGRACHGPLRAILPCPLVTAGLKRPSHPPAGYRPVKPALRRQAWALGGGPVVAGDSAKVWPERCSRGCMRCRLCDCQRRDRLYARQRAPSRQARHHAGRPGAQASDALAVSYTVASSNRGRRGRAAIGGGRESQACRSAACQGLSLGTQRGTCAQYSR
jgi:hypothetical protein